MLDLQIKKKLALLFKEEGTWQKKNPGWSVLKKKQKTFFKMMLNKFMLKKNKVRQYQYL